MTKIQKNERMALYAPETGTISAADPDIIPETSGTANLTANAFRKQYLARVPAQIKDSLSDEQLAAMADIAAAMRSAWAKRHQVDMRMSVKLWFTKYYLTVVAGPDVRVSGRSREDAVATPWRRLCNVLFIGIVAAGFYSLAALALLLYSAVITF